MKKHILKFVLLGQFLFFSCDGDFVADESGIFLSFPTNNEPCYEGNKIGEKINIPFEWILNGENLNDLQIEINELDATKNLIESSETITSNIINTQLRDTISLDYGKWYQWKIVSTSTEIKSKVFTFYSEGEPEENAAPFPAEINIISNNGGNLLFTWQEPFDKENNDLLYDVFFGKNQNPETKIRIDESDPVEVLEENLEVNVEYYIKVVSKENLSGNSIGNSSVSIKKIKINP